MGKTNKIRKYHKRKSTKGKTGQAKNNFIEAISLNEYFEKIKESKKYIESLDYLKSFVESQEEDFSSWKFKSNIQTFIKKHILIKNIYDSKAFSDFQIYVYKMAKKEEFIEICKEIINKINNEDKKIVYDILTQPIKPLEEEDYNKLADKILKRCIILVENSD